MLCDLLHDMRDLRLTLAADLSAAAGAAEHGSPDIAGQIVDADQRDVAAFRRRAVERLIALDADADVPPPTTPVTATAPRQWRRRMLVSLPAVPLAGALAMSAAAAAGLLPVPGHTSHRTITPSASVVAPVTSMFDHFEAVLNSDPSAAQVINAATALHDQIAALLATAPHDPTRVGEVAHLLQLEQALLLRTQPPGSSVVLAASRQLAAKLLHLAPMLSTSQPTSAAMPASQSSPSHHPTQPASSPTPKATTKQSTPAPTPTQSATPTPTSTSTSGYPNNLPGLHN